MGGGEDGKEIALSRKKEASKEGDGLTDLTLLSGREIARANVNVCAQIGEVGS